MRDSRGLVVLVPTDQGWTVGVAPVGRHAHAALSGPLPWGQAMAECDRLRREHGLPVFDGFAMTPLWSH